MTTTDTLRAVAGLEPRPGVRGATIITHSGLYFDFLDPKPEQIVVQDIAWGLANTCRFNGQCNGFYSVAQHSVLVSHIVPADQALAALLHDAAEAYTGDMVKPLKQLLPDFKVVEERVESAIFDKFSLPPEVSPEIKHADLRLLRTEQRDLTSGARDNWNGLDQYEPLKQPIVMQSPAEAYLAFRSRYMQLVDDQMMSWPSYPVPAAVLNKPRGYGKKLSALITDIAEELRRRGRHATASDIDSFRGLDPRTDDRLARLIVDEIVG